MVAKFFFGTEWLAARAFCNAQSSPHVIRGNKGTGFTVEPSPVQVGVPKWIVVIHTGSLVGFVRGEKVAVKALGDGRIVVARQNGYHRIFRKEVCESHLSKENAYRLPMKKAFQLERKLNV
jgi:hypothetical protein